MCFGVGVDGLHHIVFENPVLGCASGFEGTQECAHGMGSSSHALIDVVNAKPKVAWNVVVGPKLLHFSVSWYGVAM
jgi:hypothetical protein